MPDLLIYGLPSEMSVPLLQELDRLLRAAVVAVRELDIPTEKVHPRFLCDDIPMDLVKGLEFAVVIDGLFIKPERTKELVQELVGAVADAMAAWLTHNRYMWSALEVRTRMHDPGIEAFCSREFQ
jgi:hypothetical protein